MEALKAEHRLVEKMFQAALSTGEDEAPRRQMLLARIAHALTKHGIEEENVVYPAMVENGHAGEARHLVEDHGDIRIFIYQLRRTPADDPRWRDTLNQFFGELQAHIRQEEEDIFPTLQAALPADENARLTRMLNWEGYKAA
jgi:hemerythrin superfamily protein